MMNNQNFTNWTNKELATAYMRCKDNGWNDIKDIYSEEIIFRILNNIESIGITELTFE